MLIFIANILIIFSSFSGGSVAGGSTFNTTKWKYIFYSTEQYIMLQGSTSKVETIFHSKS
jgi:hypothetical protein